MTTSRLAENHPSYLALDRASLGEPSPELAAHLQSCAECRDYVAALAEPPPAAGILLFIGVRPQPDLPAGPHGELPYVGTKGFASVWIYVKHGPNTELWDGKRPLFAGDRLRLKLDPGRFRHVAVYSVKGPDTPTLLYAGNVTPAESTTLPEAWEVDSEPGAERLVVAFSDQALEPTWPNWLQGKAPPGVTVLPFVLPKSSSPDPDAGSTSP
jgi:hypothetical protein